MQILWFRLLFSRIFDCSLENDIFLLEWYFGAMHGASSTFSKAVIPSRNYRGDSFSTKDTIDSIAGPTLDIMDICSEGNKIVLVYHSYVRFYSMLDIRFLSRKI